MGPKTFMPHEFIGKLLSYVGKTMVEFNYVLIVIRSQHNINQLTTSRNWVVV